MDDSAWISLIRDRNIWIEHNFPGPDMPNSLLGVIEELGELTHAHLKSKQNIRGDQEKHPCHPLYAFPDSPRMFCFDLR